MRAWIRARRWSLLVAAVVLFLALTLLRSCLVPEFLEMERSLRLRDSLVDLEASLPNAREEWRRLRLGEDARVGKVLSLAGMDSLLTECGIEHEPLKAVSENGRTRLSVTFKGTTFGLHRAWRAMAGWTVVDWSVQPSEKGIRGTFRLEVSRDEVGS